MRRALLLGGLALAGCQAVPVPPIPKLSVAELRREIPADLAITRTQIPDARNGWKIALPSRGEFRGIRDWEGLTRDDLSDPAKAATAREAVKRLDPLLAKLRRGVALTWQIPAREPLDVAFPEFATLKSLAKAGVLRANLALEEDRPQDAVADLLMVRNLADRLAKAEGANVIAYLVASAIRAIGNRALLEAASHPNMTPAVLETALKGVPDPGATDPALARALRYELAESFVPMLATMHGPIEAEDTDPEGRILRDHPKRLDARETVRLFAKGVAVQAANASRPWREQKSNEAHIAELRAGWPESVFEEDGKPTDAEIASARDALEEIANPLGRRMAADSLAAFEKFGYASFRWRADAAATRLALLLARAQKGGAKLGTVPRDPFSNGPMRHDPVRRIVWSVGADGRDDGGNGKGYGAMRDPDLVFPLDRKPIRPNVRP